MTRRPEARVAEGFVLCQAPVDLAPRTSRAWVQAVEPRPPIDSKGACTNTPDRQGKMSVLRGPEPWCNGSTGSPIRRCLFVLGTKLEAWLLGGLSGRRLTHEVRPQGAAHVPSVRRRRTAASQSCELELPTQTGHPDFPEGAAEHRGLQ